MAFIAASDELGMGISGVRDGDTFELVGAVGIATFTQESTNAGVASIATIVAAGAALTAAAFGQAALVPFITAAGTAVGNAFPNSKNPGKPRDPYGQDPATGEFAEEEGGLLVCSPDAQGVWHSGDDDHRSYWLKSHNNRHPDTWPRHVQHAFFLERDRTPRVLEGAGELIISPWDYRLGR